MLEERAGRVANVAEHHLNRVQEHQIGWATRAALRSALIASRANRGQLAVIGSLTGLRARDGCGSCRASAAHQYAAGAINGGHVIIYSGDAEADRALFETRSTTRMSTPAPAG